VKRWWQVSVVASTGYLLLGHDDPLAASGCSSRRNCQNDAPVVNMLCDEEIKANSEGAPVPLCKVSAQGSCAHSARGGEVTCKSCRRRRRSGGGTSGGSGHGDGVGGTAEAYAKGVVAGGVGGAAGGAAAGAVAGALGRVRWPEESRER
jgi:hypothetical protein